MDKAIAWIVLIVGVLLVLAEFVEQIADFSSWIVAIGFLALGIKMTMHQR